MRRRRFIAGLGGVVAMTASPMAAPAQPGSRMRRLGVLSAFAEHDAENKVRITNFLTRLQSLGWRAGENVIVEYRYAFGDADRIQTAVKEIVALAPEVIMTMSNPVLAALIRETRTVPIVFAQVADPVGSGFVASLAVLEATSPASQI